MNKVLDSSVGARRVNVIVELGGEHGRTGARTTKAARAGADVASPSLALAGVDGYEGALGHDRSAAGLAAVRTYLNTVGALHRELLDADLYGTHAIVTAGGSAIRTRRSSDWLP